MISRWWRAAKGVTERLEIMLLSCVVALGILLAFFALGLILRD